MVLMENNILQFKTKNSYSSYLKILSFADLMSESNSIMNEIKYEYYGFDLQERVKLIMEEFSNRLEKDSKSLSDQVKHLKKILNKK